MTTTRAALCGFALVVVLLAVFVGIGAAPPTASAANLEPCETTNPTGPIVELEGEFTLAPMHSTRKAWKRSGIRQKLIKPANQLTGRPTFPVGKVTYGSPATVDFKGGLKLRHRNRSVSLTRITVLSAAGKPAWVRASAGQGKVNFFSVKGGRRTFDTETGELSRVGYARLTASGAKVLNRRLGLSRKQKLKAGTVWGYLNLYALYKVTEVDDPTGETPEEPPVKPQPPSALPVTSAATVKWYVRDSFINYVASGAGTRVENGATADPASGPLDLVYSFNFPFTSGWTIPETPEDPENTLIRSSGTVGFRYCTNTINFTVSDPEIELEGDTASRLIFKVNGTDGTAFPDQRAVMVKLMPGLAESHNVIDNGNGTRTVSYVKIPGFVPPEGTGIFAGFYPGYSPEFEGQDPRPDRFGFFTLTYTYSTGS